MKNIDPKRYNLSARTVLRQSDKNSVFIVLDRKSRIVMKDGYRILTQAKTILQIKPTIIITVLASAPVCSKTRSFLLQNNIQVNEL
ncbi:MAG: hypothetical protein HOB40_05680 [Candidatus Marinimicrobia bacterium]|jgi:hypothetical protein|nr:hypothetical protein [Candidatus Neomarinimicrobiota bacterium]MBT3840293.1 hypothetical protein [Candidatus Neomarinimicrobiota bacterium]MBT4000291.1 hypothetical protein [Candidatus Neomarinimicrobiota bacterium]MBT4382619.1 hypothetical protein [Candidatus Neomarinimicrobiota bacterium]MBT4578498.1 hypothetical protein [Candidatus Neomarinimicrobiota bacterium]